MDAARGIEQLHAMIIAQKGAILEAEAFRGPPLDRPVNVKSVSKSFVSALTGMAIARGEIAGLDTPVAPLIARQVPRRADKRVRDITVRHMLSMQSGLQEVSGAAYGDWVDTKFWIYEALSKPMVADPGTAYLYSTASYHVLGAILSAVAGKDLHRLATERLGQPLGIKLPPWTRDPQGLYVGGNDMRVSPLGLLAFGEIYRRGGLHQETELLSLDWVAQSWTPYGTSRETGHGYGFGWFIWDLGDGLQVRYARGYGGQMIFVLPEREMTVVITSQPGLPATMDGHLGALFRLFEQHVLPMA
jgi:CubicO group peptidase (beta-lactamase class C family)